MLPYTTLGLLIFVAVLVPGFVWLRVSEARVFRPRRSPVLEVTELAILGCCFTTGAALLIAALSLVWSPPLLNIPTWMMTSNMAEYLLSNLPQFALFTLLTISLSIAFAAGTARIVYRGRSADPPSWYTVWQELHERSQGNASPFLGLDLIDGQVIEGYLHRYPTPESDNDNQVSLCAPIYYQDKETKERVLSNLDVAIISESKIVKAGVIFLDPLHAEARAEQSTVAKTTADG